MKRDKFEAYCKLRSEAAVLERKVEVLDRMLDSGWQYSAIQFYRNRQYRDEAIDRGCYFVEGNDVSPVLRVGGDDELPIESIKNCIRDRRNTLQRRIDELEKLMEEL